MPRSLASMCLATGLATLTLGLALPSPAASDPRDERARAAPRREEPSPYGFGARVGGYGFRRNQGDRREAWDECRMNGMGIFGERRFGPALFVETGLDVYFTESFPMAPSSEALPIDRVSGLVTAAAGLRGTVADRLAGYAQLGIGLELTQVSVPYGDGAIADRMAMPEAFLGVGADLLLGARIHVGASLRLHAMGNFSYDPEDLEMQPGWTTPPTAAAVFDPDTDLAAQGQFYVRRDL